MNTDCRDVTNEGFWDLPYADRRTVLLDLRRRYLAEVPNADAFTAWTWANEAAYTTAGTQRHRRVHDILADRIQLELTITWIQRQITALETFGCSGRNGAHEGIVYFLRAGPFVKIGFTAGSIQGRMRELSTGCPYPQTLIGYRLATMATEKWLHQLFAQQRANLEWFHVSEMLLKSLAALSESEFNLRANFSDEELAARFSA